MKIYTKTGDKGETSLLGGKRVPKYHIRIEAYGTVDELNANIGMLISNLHDERSIEVCRKLQSRLFDIGSSLATSPEGRKEIETIDGEYIDLLEEEIDHMELHLPALRNFILPGSSSLNAQAHICRTICRRAERRVIELANEDFVNQNIIILLNRLSDYFFVLSRWISHSRNEIEIKWLPGKNKV